MQFFAIFKLRSLQIFNLTSKMTVFSSSEWRLDFSSIWDKVKKMANIQKVFFFICVMPQRTHLIRSEAWKSCWSVRRALNKAQSSNSHWSSTKCDFQDLNAIVYGLRVRNVYRFPLHPDNRRIFIWRECCFRNNPAFEH